jgi:phosphoribosylformylglycinamidine cyclo-ligase
LADAGAIDSQEMARTFNCGIGMVVVVAKDYARDVMEKLTANGEKIFQIGEVEKNLSEHRVTLQGLGHRWPC